MKLSNIITEIKLNKEPQVSTPMELLRGYRLNEIQKEIYSVEETSDNIYPEDIKTNIINQMKQLYRKPVENVVDFVDISSEVENTDAFDNELSSISIDDQENFQTLMQNTSFPPPIIIDYKNKKRLIGGNRRAVRLNIESNRLGLGSIPVLLIKVEI